jgi:outer membrane protein insertion porin family
VRAYVLWVLGVFLACSASTVTAPAKAQDGATAKVKSIRIEGLTHLPEPQALTMSGLAVGAVVGKQELQGAADKLLQTGLFASVNYSYQSKDEGLYLTFKVAEAPRIPVFFDNLPWFADSELNDAIRKTLPFYDETLPEQGATVDQVNSVLMDLIASRGLKTTVEHQVMSNPLGEGTVQEFRISDVALHIASVEFGDPALASSKTLRQHMSEIVGKPYSRTAIDLFLAEQVKPIYYQQGFLRAKLGPPEVRLTGNPNQKLPEQIPIFVPIDKGAAYHWKSAQWTGNTVLSVFTLNNLIGVKSGEIANGMTIEAGLDRMREEYGHLGYLDAKVNAEADYDDQAHMVSYRISISEGRQYKFGKLILTGISVTAEKRLRAAWPILSDDTFDKTKFEEILLKLQVHPQQIFVDLPIHYETVGHWLQTDESTGVVDVLLDFK